MIEKQKSLLRQKISNLLSRQEYISVHDIAVVMGFPKLTAAQRKSIQRALAKLVFEGLLKSKGNLKSRVYVLSSKTESTESIDAEDIAPEIQIQKIHFSKKSLLLLNIYQKNKA